jgi:hypothetical protein
MYALLALSCFTCVAVYKLLHARSHNLKRCKRAVLLDSPHSKRCAWQQLLGSSKAHMYAPQKGKLDAKHSQSYFYFIFIPNLFMLLDLLYFSSLHSYQPCQKDWSEKRRGREGHCVGRGAAFVTVTANLGLSTASMALERSATAQQR